FRRVNSAAPLKRALVRNLGKMTEVAFRRVNSAAPLKRGSTRHVSGLQRVIPPSELGGSIGASCGEVRWRSYPSIPPSELGGSIEAHSLFSHACSSCSHSAE